MKRAAVVSLMLLTPFIARGQIDRAPRSEQWVLIGTLSAEVSDDFERQTSDTRFYLETDEGKRYEVMIEDGIRTEQIGARVRIRAQKTQGEPLLLSRRDDIEVLAEFRPLVAGTPRVAVMLFDFNDSPAARPFTANFVRNQIFGTVRSYYQEVSFGAVSNLDVTVFDWISLPDEASSPCDYQTWGDKARAHWAAQGVDFGQFHHRVHIFPQAESCGGWGGRGEVPGNDIWINGKLSATIHELGHNFGSWHAGGCFDYPGSPPQPCSSISTYADFFDAMGINEFPHMAAYRKLLLGWSPVVQDVAVSGTPQDLEIYPIEFREGASVQALRIPTPAYEGGHLWLEYRQPYGFDAPLGSAMDGVLVRYVPSSPLPSTSGLGTSLVDTALIQIFPNEAFNDDILKPGQGFSDTLNGIHVFFAGNVEYTPGKKKALVQVSFGSTPAPPPSCRRPPQVNVTQADPDIVRKRAYDVEIVNRDLPFGECVSARPKFTLSFTEPPNAGRWKHKPSSYTTPALPPAQGTASARVRRVKIFPKETLPIGSLHTFMESVTSNRSAVHSVAVPGSYRVGDGTGTSVGTTAFTDTPYPDLKVNGLDDAEVVVASGAFASVSWTSQYAASCTLRRNGSTLATGLSGSRSEFINSARTYELTCTASDGSSATDTIAVVTQASPPAQTPFLGTPFAVPGTMQAEDFDNGGDGIAWHDTDPGNGWGAYRANVDVDIAPAGDVGSGHVVANARAGEWLEYTVNVASAGNYTFEARVASGGPGGTFHVELNGVNKTGTITVPNTGGWGNWQTISRAVNLSAGQQVMRVALDANGSQSFPAVADFNWFRLVSTAVPPLYEGYVDSANCTAMAGWAADRNRLNTSISVDIYDGTSYLSTVAANQSRPDVGSYLGDNGLHGFTWTVPASLKNGLPHNLYAKYAGTSSNLGNTPRTITCSGSCTPSCNGVVCGSPNGCGGTCNLGSGCSSGCNPQCSGHYCGNGDGCGGICGFGSGCASGCNPACNGVACGELDPACGDVCQLGSGCF